MHLYTIGYSDYEEAPYTVLTHEKQFAKEEFQKLVHDIWIVEMKFEQGRLNDATIPGRTCKVRDAYDLTVEKLISDHGFKAPEFAANFSAVGYQTLEEFKTKHVNY